MILAAVAVVVLILAIKYVYHENVVVPRAPLHRGGFKWPFLGDLPSFLWTMVMRNGQKNHWWLDRFRHAGPLSAFYFTIPSNRVVAISNPIDIEYVLKTNFDNFIKGDKFFAVFGDVLGHGIFAVDGHKWQLQRKLASHEFSVNRFRYFQLEVFEREASTLANVLARAIATKTPVDLQAYFSRFTLSDLDSVCDIAFGHNPHSLEHGDSEFVTAFDFLTSRLFWRFVDPTYQLMRWLGMGDEGRVPAAVACVDKFLYGIVDSVGGDTHLDKGDNLLQRFRGATDDHGQPLTREFLRDICLSFVLAGRDTTAACLSWLFYALACNSHIEEKLLAELGSLGQVPTFEDYKHQLPYLQAVVSETLRLYPSVPEDGRMCVKEDVLPSGVRVPAGADVAIFPWVTARLEAIWGPDAEDFRPERWLDDSGAFVRVSPFLNPVFWAGPRQCLGIDMAQLEVKVAVATLLPRLRFERIDSGPCTYGVSLTMPILRGLPVRVYTRGKIGMQNCG